MWPERSPARGSGSRAWNREEAHRLARIRLDNALRLFNLPESKELASS